MSDPASCIPPNPEVSGWWYLGHSINAPSLWWWSSLVRCWRTEASTNCSPPQMADYGYRILGPVPSHADVVEARGQIAQDGKEIERLEAQLTAANAAIETIESLSDGDAHALCQLDAQLTAANAEIARLKAQTKAATIYPEGVTTTHKSDCAVNNMPALPAGPCDCGYLVTVRREDLREVLWRDINPEMPFKVAEGEVAARLTAMEDAVNGT